MDYLKIHDWDQWQTYRKDRGQPPWIKIHRQVMRNVKWVSLSDAERGQLVAIWLLAADHDGAIPASPEIIQKLCFLSSKPNINKFIELGFIESNGCHIDANVTPDRRQSDQPKAEAETETDICPKSTDDDQLFDLFWLNYPKKVGKQAALKAWKKLKNHSQIIELMKITLPKQMESDQWNKEGGQYIPNPATYLNQGRWEDETV